MEAKEREGKQREAKGSEWKRMVAKGSEGKRREAKGSEGKRSISGATRHRSRTGLPRALVRDDVSCQGRVRAFTTTRTPRSRTDWPAARAAPRAHCAAAPRAPTQVRRSHVGGGRRYDTLAVVCVGGGKFPRASWPCEDHASRADATDRSSLIADRCRCQLPGAWPCRPRRSPPPRATSTW